MSELYYESALCHLDRHDHVSGRSRGILRDYVPWGYSHQIHVHGSLPFPSEVAGTGPAHVCDRWSVYGSPRPHDPLCGMPHNRGNPSNCIQSVEGKSRWEDNMCIGMPQ